MENNIIDFASNRKKYLWKLERTTNSINMVNRIALIEYKGHLAYSFSNPELTATLEYVLSNEPIIKILVNQFYQNRMAFLEKYKKVKRIVISITKDSSSYGIILKKNRENGYDQILHLELSVRVYDPDIPNDFQFLARYLNEVMQDSNKFIENVELEEDKESGLKTIKIGENIYISYDSIATKYVAREVNKKNNEIIDKKINLRRN